MSLDWVDGHMNVVDNDTGKTRILWDYDCSIYVCIDIYIPPFCVKKSIVGINLNTENRPNPKIQQLNPTRFPNHGLYKSKELLYR